MKSVVIVSSVLAAAGAAMAAPFNALSYEAGGGLPGIVGEGFTVSSGGFWLAPGAGSNVLGGEPGNFNNTTNWQDLDSHFSLDPFGPSARNRTTGTGNNSSLTLTFYGNYGPPGTTANPNPGHPAGDYVELEAVAGSSFIVGPGSHVDGAGANANRARAGIGVAPPVGQSAMVPSTFAPNMTGGRSTFDGVFIGRFTIQEGASLSGGIFFNTLVSPGTSFGANLTLGGPAVAFDTHNGQQLLALRGYKLGTRNIFNEDEEILFGNADVWDIWVQLVPAPGALALFGVGGLAAIRRRRA